MQLRQMNRVALGAFIAAVMLSGLALAAGKITGRVIDVDGKPLGGMVVRIQTPVDFDNPKTSGKIKYKATTDKDGKFAIDNVDAGKYTAITMEQRGGQAAKEVEVQDGKEATVELQTRKKR